MDDKLFEDKKYDESLFDDKSQDASLFEDVTHPEVAEDKSSPVVQAVIQGAKGTGGLVGGGAIGYGLGALLKATGEKGAEMAITAGPLSKEQTDFISLNPKTYKSSSGNDLEKLLGEFKQISEGVSSKKTNQARSIIDTYKGIAGDVSKAGFEKARAAKDYLSTPEAVGLSKDDYAKAVGNAIANAEGATADFSVNQQSRVIGEHLAQKQESIGKLQAQTDQLEKSMSQFDKGSDPYEAVRKQVETAKQQLNIAKASALDEARDAARKYRGVPDELVETHPALQNKKILPAFQSQVESALQLSKEIPGPIIDPVNLGGKYGLVNQLKANANYNTKPGADTPDQAMAKNLGKEVRSSLGAVNKPYDDLQQASSRAIAVGDKMGFDPNDFEEGNLVLKDSQAKRIEKILANPELFPEDFANLQKELTGAEEFTDKAITPEMQQELEKQVALEKKLSKVKDTTAGENKLIKFSGLQNSPEYKELAGALDQSSVPMPGETPRAGKEFLDQVQSSNIKKTIDDGSGLSNYSKNKILSTGTKAGLMAFAGGSVGGQTGAAVGAGVGVAADVYGAKLQELIALNEHTKIGKVAKGFNSMLPGLLGAGGAVIGATAAAQAGELSPVEAGVAAIGESANMIPGTDVVSGMVEAKKSAKAEQALHTPEEIQLSQDMAMAGDLGADPAQGVLNANPVSAAAQRGFHKGFVSPITEGIPAAVKYLGGKMDEFGTSQSNEARSRMEKRMNTLTGLKKSKEPEQASINEFKELSSEDLNTLAQMFSASGDKATQSFSAPLEKAAGAEEGRTKDAILWGLHQQPAFRQMYKKIKQPM